MNKVILVYHQIDGDDPFMSVKLNEFKKQINYLVKKKFNFCNVDTLMKRKKGKHVSIIFDDGYKSILPALNYLKSKKLEYSIAVIENKLDTNTFLSKKDLSGTIYFHTNNHVDLTKLSIPEIKHELLCDYKKYSRCLVYPQGRYDKNVIEVASKNYKYALSLLPFHVTRKSKNYELPRICVNGYLKFLKFKLFVSKIGNIYLHLAFLKRKVLGQDYLSR